MARKRTHTHNRPVRSIPPIKHAWLRARVRPVLACVLGTLMAGIINLSDHSLFARLLLVGAVCLTIAMPFLVDTRRWEAVNQSPETREAFRQLLATRYDGSGLASDLASLFRIVLICSSTGIGIELITGVWWSPKPNWTLFWILYIPTAFTAVIAMTYWELHRDSD